MNEGNLNENIESSFNRKGFPNKNNLTYNGSFIAEKPFSGNYRIDNDLDNKIMQLQSILKNPNTLLRSQQNQLNFCSNLTLGNYNDIDVNKHSCSQIYSPKTVSVKSNNNNRKNSANKKANSSVFNGQSSLSSSKIFSNNLNSDDNNKNLNIDCCELERQNSATKNSSSNEQLYEKTHIKKPASNSKFAIIEASSSEKNNLIYNNLMQSNSSKTSQSYKKDVSARSICFDHRNTSKERKTEQGPNLINKRKSSKNRIDSINDNKNTKNFDSNKISKENLLPFTVKVENDIKNYNNFYKGYAMNTSDDSALNCEKFKSEKPVSNLIRNESAKDLNQDRNKLTSIFNINNDSNNLMTAESHLNINCGDFNFDDYLERKNSKTKFLSYRKHYENSVNSRYSESFSKNRRENSQTRKYPETTERLGSKGKKRNESSQQRKKIDSFNEYEEKLIIKAKPNKASNLYLAENRKMIMKMPTLKYENISRKPYNHFQKSHSSKFQQENLTASAETSEENPSDTFSLERASNFPSDLNVLASCPQKQQKTAPAEPLKTEDSRDFTSKETNLSSSNYKNNRNKNNQNTNNSGINYKDKNNFNNGNSDSNILLSVNSNSPKTNISSSKKLVLNKINLKKLSNYIDFLQKEKITEDLKTLKAQKTFESGSTVNKYSEPDNNFSSSRQTNNYENENSVFYTVNTECNSIGTSNLNSKNLNDCENEISNSLSINYLGNEYVRKLENTFMQVNRKGFNMQSSMQGDNETNYNENQSLCDYSNKNNFCVAKSFRNVVSGGNVFEHSANISNLKFKNIDNNKINFTNKNGNQTGKNKAGNNVNEISTFEESKRNNTKFDSKNNNNKNNLNSNSKQKLKTVYNNNSNLSLRNYVVAKENSLKHNNREGWRGEGLKRSKSKNDNKNNSSKNKEPKLNQLNPISPKENLEHTLNNSKSQKNLNTSKTNNNSNNTEKKNINFSAIFDLNSNSAILRESKNKKSSKDKSLKKPSSKSKLISNCEEKERLQTAKIGKESCEKQPMKPISRAILPHKSAKIKLIPANTKNNFAVNNNESNFKSNYIQSDGDFQNNNLNADANNNLINYNSKYKTEKTIHINHNFNHNINHNILINIENPEGISAENFKKSLEKFHSGKNNKINSLLQKPQNSTGAGGTQIRTTNPKLNLGNEKDESFSELNLEYLNTDDAKISGSDSKIRDIISTLELAKESNTNLKIHKKNYKNITNNHFNYDKNLKENKNNFYCENKEEQKIADNKKIEKLLLEPLRAQNHLSISQKNINLRIPSDTIICNKEMDKGLFNSMISVKDKLKNSPCKNSNNMENKINSKDLNSKEPLTNSSNRIINKDTNKFNLQIKESYNDAIYDRNNISRPENKLTNNENNNINKSNQLNKSNSNNKLLEELKYNLSLKQNYPSKELKEENTNGTNFEALRKNLLVSHNNNNKNPNSKESPNLKETHKFDKMEFFKCKNAAIEKEADEENDNFYSREALNTEPNLPFRPEKIKATDKEGFIKNLNFNKSNFKFSMQEGKLSFLDKPTAQNLNPKSNTKSELKEDKSLAENGKSAAKPSYLSESVNINFRPLDFLKNQLFVKNKNLNLSLKFPGNTSNSLKENTHFNKKLGSEDIFNTISAEKRIYLDNDFVKDKVENIIDEGVGENLTENLNANEKLNLFNVHKKFNLIKNKNELFETINHTKYSNNNYNLNKKENKKLRNNSNNALTDEESNMEAHSKKSKKNALKLNSHSLKNSSSSKSKSKSYTGSQNKDRESIPKEKDLLEQTISYIISDDEPNSKENKSNLNLNTEESYNNNINKNTNCKSSLYHINNPNEEIDFEKFYEEMNMKLMSNQSSNRK